MPQTHRQMPKTWPKHARRGAHSLSRVVFALWQLQNTQSGTLDEDSTVQNEEAKEAQGRDRLERLYALQLLATSVLERCLYDVYYGGGDVAWKQVGIPPILREMLQTDRMKECLPDGSLCTIITSYWHAFAHASDGWCTCSALLSCKI